MPELIKVYIKQVLIGFGLSAVFVASLLYGNVANLRHLVIHTDVGTLAVFLLWLFNGIVLAGVQFAVHIMTMNDDDDDDGPGGGLRERFVQRELIPVRVEATSRPTNNTRYTRPRG